VAQFVIVKMLLSVLLKYLKTNAVDMVLVIVMQTALVILVGVALIVILLYLAMVMLVIIAQHLLIPLSFLNHSAYGVLLLKLANTRVALSLFVY